jgi:hypothetical protein
MVELWHAGPRPAGRESTWFRSARSAGLVYYFDGDCQDASAAYRKALEANGLVGSVSRKGDG